MQSQTVRTNEKEQNWLITGPSLKPPRSHTDTMRVATQALFKSILVSKVIFATTLRGLSHFDIISVVIIQVYLLSKRTDGPCQSLLFICNSDHPNRQQRIDRPWSNIFNDSLSIIFITVTTEIYSRNCDIPFLHKLPLPWSPGCQL